tara:strand:+ start:436 stop:828 length:393 start_codon:yes stop_codon:yes gene_type:complete
MSSKFSSPFMAKSPLNNVGVLGKLVKTFASAAKQYGRKAFGKSPKSQQSVPSKPRDLYKGHRQEHIDAGMSPKEAMDRFPTKAHFEDTATPEQVKAMSKAAGVDVPGDILSYHPQFRQTVIDNYNKTLKK